MAPKIRNLQTESVTSHIIPEGRKIMVAKSSPEHIIIKPINNKITLQQRSENWA